MRVSVIMPVFNAAATVQRSLESLAVQSFRDFEVVIVDDCSTDATIDVINRFSSNSVLDLHIVHLDRNGGVASARNAGLDAAKGDYVYFMDADDWLEKDALEDLFSKIDSEELDIVGCNWNLVFESKSRHMTQPEYSSPSQAFELLMYGRMRWNLWLFMIRRSLFEGVRFIPGQDMGEDMMVMIRLFMKSSKVGRVDSYLYNYAQPGLSKTMSERNISQVTANVAALEEVVKGSDYEGKCLNLLPKLKLGIKLPLLIGLDKNQYRRWLDWWPEVNDRAIDNPVLPLRTRLLQWMASRRLWTFVWLYNAALSVFYKVLYR